MLAAVPTKTQMLPPAICACAKIISETFLLGIWLSALGLPFHGQERQQQQQQQRCVTCRYTQRECDHVQALKKFLRWSVSEASRMLEGDEPNDHDIPAIGEGIVRMPQSVIDKVAQPPTPNDPSLCNPRAIPVQYRQEPSQFNNPSLIPPRAIPV